LEDPDPSRQDRRSRPVMPVRRRATRTQPAALRTVTAGRALTGGLPVGT
jgi:hypothetical protein